MAMAASAPSPTNRPANPPERQHHLDVGATALHSPDASTFSILRGFSCRRAVVRDCYQHGSLPRPLFPPSNPPLPPTLARPRPPPKLVLPPIGRSRTRTRHAVRSAGEGQRIGGTHANPRPRGARATVVGSPGWEFSPCRSDTDPICISFPQHRHTRARAHSHRCTHTRAWLERVCLCAS